MTVKRAVSWSVDLSHPKKSLYISDRFTFIKQSWQLLLIRRFGKKGFGIYLNILDTPHYMLPIDARFEVESVKSTSHKRQCQLTFGPTKLKTQGIVNFASLEDIGQLAGCNSFVSFKVQVVSMLNGHLEFNSRRIHPRRSIDCLQYCVEFLDNPTMCAQPCNNFGLTVAHESLTQNSHTTKSDSTNEPNDTFANDTFGRTINTASTTPTSNATVKVLEEDVAAHPPLNLESKHTLLEMKLAQIKLLQQFVQSKRQKLLEIQQTVVKCTETQIHI